MGELEKRILIKAEQHSRHIDKLMPELNKIIGDVKEKPVTVHINTENMTVKMWDVFHIVEEMQQEFPTEDSVLEERPDWKAKRDLDWQFFDHLIFLALKKEREKWFEKWFSKGDVST